MHELYYTNHKVCKSEKGMPYVILSKGKKFSILFPIKELVKQNKNFFVLEENSTDLFKFPTYIDFKERKIIRNGDLPMYLDEKEKIYSLSYEQSEYAYAIYYTKWKHRLPKLNLK